MIGLIQRVSEASVKVEGRIVGQIARGLLVLVGVEKHDDQANAQRLLERLLGYRVFPDESGKMNLSLADIGGDLLLVPQFTLAADTRKGTRPSFSSAAAPELGAELFEYFVAAARERCARVETGVFGADMKVSLVNDGPVTFCAGWKAMRLGVDLGGTKIEIVALDDAGKQLLRRRVVTPKDNYHKTLQVIAALVHAAEAELGQHGSLGIGTPGSLSRATGRLKNSNSVVFNGQPIQQDLEALLQRPVQISNDANCFALSEAVDGAAAGAEVVFGVILGTGVGAGIVVNGHVLTGPNGIAGEWGHNPLPWPEAHELPGPSCYCGKQGCVETFLSGSGMAKLHQMETGISLGAEEIVARAEQGDTTCESSLQTFENRLARSLAHVINILDPDVIVLGGGMSNIERLYANVPAQWGRWVFSDRVDTKLVKNQYGDSSGVRGAAWL